MHRTLRIKNQKATLKSQFSALCLAFVLRELHHENCAHLFSDDGLLLVNLQHFVFSENAFDCSLEMRKKALEKCESMGADLQWHFKFYVL